MLHVFPTCLHIISLSAASFPPLPTPQIPQPEQKAVVVSPVLHISNPTIQQSIHLPYLGDSSCRPKTRQVPIEVYPQPQFFKHSQSRVMRWPCVLPPDFQISSPTPTNSLQIPPHTSLKPQPSLILLPHFFTTLLHTTNQIPQI